MWLNTKPHNVLSIKEGIIIVFSSISPYKSSTKLKIQHAFSPLSGLETKLDIIFNPIH